MAKWHPIHIPTAETLKPFNIVCNELILISYDRKLANYPLTLRFPASHSPESRGTFSDRARSSSIIFSK